MSVGWKSLASLYLLTMRLASIEVCWRAFAAWSLLKSEVRSMKEAKSARAFSFCLWFSRICRTEGKGLRLLQHPLLFYGTHRSREDRSTERVEVWKAAVRMLSTWQLITEEITQEITANRSLSDLTEKKLVLKFVVSCSNSKLTAQAQVIWNAALFRKYRALLYAILIFFVIMAIFLFKCKSFNFTIIHVPTTRPIFIGLLRPATNVPITYLTLYSGKNIE